MSSESSQSEIALLNPPLVKLALWTGSIGLGAYLLRRFLRRGPGAIDVGPVSDAWLASRRGIADELPYY